MPEAKTHKCRYCEKPIEAHELCTITVRVPGQEKTTEDYSCRRCLDMARSRSDGCGRRATR